MGRSFSIWNDFSHIGNLISSRIPKLGKMSDYRAFQHQYGSKYLQGPGLPERLYSKAQLTEVDSEKMGGIA
jgi:hypothetical protein